MIARQWHGGISEKGVIPHEDHDGRCQFCGESLFFKHGMIRTPTGSINVCPGDWIIFNDEGIARPIKPDLYEFLLSVKGLIES